MNLDGIQVQEREVTVRRLAGETFRGSAGRGALG
jgi:hypothetical protein